MWVVRRGVAAWRVVDCAVGGSVMPCRVAERAVSGTRDGTYGGTRGETMNAPFLSARLGVLSDGGGVVDGCGREVCRGRGGVIRMSLLFFFLPLVSDEAGGGYVSSVSFLRLASRLAWRLVYSVSVCVSSGRLAFCLVSVSL